MPTAPRGRRRLRSQRRRPGGRDFRPRGIAEDRSRIPVVDISVAIGQGTYDHCVRTKDWSPLEPDTIENKWFCPGVGQVLAEKVKGDPAREEMTEIKNP
jgi:hypothetical protein